MTRFQATLPLAAFPRERLETVLSSAVEFAESLRFEGGRLRISEQVDDQVRLVEGEHLASGARYRITDTTPEDEPNPELLIHLRSWNPRGTIDLAAEIRHDDGSVEGTLTIEHDGPGVARIRSSGVLGLTGPRFRRWKRVNWDADIDLNQWWARTAGADERGGPPIRVTLRHPLAQLRCTLNAASADDDRWTVKLSIAARGRRLMRPLFAVPLLIGRLLLARRARPILKAAAARWNTTVPHVLQQEIRDELWLRRRVTVDALTEEHLSAYLQALHDEVERLPQTPRLTLIERQYAEPDEPDDHDNETFGYTPDKAIGEGPAEALHGWQSATVKLRSWDRSTESRVDITAGASTGSLTIHSAEQPESLFVEGSTLEPDVQWQATADLGALWKLDSPATIVTGTARHLLGQADLSCEVAPVAPGNWQIDASASITGNESGRLLLRGFTALGGFHLLKALRELDPEQIDVPFCDELADGLLPLPQGLVNGWNRACHEPPEELAERSITSFLAARPDES